MKLRMNFRNVRTFFKHILQVLHTFFIHIIHMYVYVYMSGVPSKARREYHPLELELQVVLSYLA